MKEARAMATYGRLTLLKLEKKIGDIARHEAQLSGALTK